MVTAKIKAEIISTIKTRIPDVMAIYIFGSYADDTSNAESDIDVAFLAKESFGNIERWKLQEHMAQRLKKDVDLIDMRQASTIMKKQVIENGERIFVIQENEVEWFESLSIWLYIDLMELNRPIYEDIKERGSVYG